MQPYVTNSLDRSSLKPFPFTIYNDSLTNKDKALKDNKRKSGVYRWVNKINGNSYVGSSVHLYPRLLNYYSEAFLTRKLLRSSSCIYLALLKYGHENFILEILEYCDKNSVIEIEQKYINLLKPEYNILSKAGSSLGFKHSAETLLKFKTRKLSVESLANLKKSKLGATFSPLAKMNQLLSTGHVVTVINKIDKVIKEYESIRAAARALKVHHATLFNYIDKDKLLKGIYAITRKK